MNILSLTDSGLVSWVILPLLIFISRIFDVSLGTMRIIFVSRGGKLIAREGVFPLRKSNSLFTRRRLGRLGK